MKTFPTWKTLTFVVYPSVEEFTKELETSGNKIGTYARQIFAKTPLAKEPVEYELVRASGRDLGITEAAKLRTIFAKASEHDLEKCPPELGPQLRREYIDQPGGELLWIAMDPIAVGDGSRLNVFGLGRVRDLRWLSTNGAYADGLWDPAHVWVFARRK